MASGLVSMPGSKAYVFSGESNEPLENLAKGSDGLSITDSFKLRGGCSKSCALGLILGQVSGLCCTGGQTRSVSLLNQ